MTTLAVSKKLFSRYGRLDPAARKRVEELAGKCAGMTIQELRESKGQHLEPYTGARDERARTIRLGGNHRGIVLVPDRGDMIVLVDILTHDDADRWMLNNEFRVNEATGALEIVDVAQLGELVDEHADTELRPDTTPLYEHRSDKEFAQLGVDSSLLPLLRVMQDEDQLEALIEHLPQGQADALILLTGTESTDTLYRSLVGSESPEEVDTEDLGAAAAAKASGGEFHVLDSEAELAEMLAKPFALWRTYLHPSQHDAAYKPTYNGPVRITGGAGTGKTVVAIHRANALAGSLEATDAPGSILFTTFTRNLAQSIERELVSLGGADLLERVEVLNIDRVAHQVVSEAEGRSPGILSGKPLERRWAETVDNLGSDLDAHFVMQEWEQVVLAQGIESRDDYFRARRSGRGTRLDRRERAKVWKVIEAATRDMAARNQRTFLQLAQDAAGYLEASAVKPYRHVVVDEAQDLHEAQWRLVRAAVEPRQNDLFIVGDSHQRIYDRRSSLSKVGIEIRGRSRRLRINYRTTHEILRWSLAILGEASFDDLDEGLESQTHADYHSFMHGPRPTVRGFDTAGDMARAVAEQVTNWIADGVDPGDIAVTSRTRAGLGTVEAVLREAGVPCHRLGKDLRTGDGTALGTMHRMKGLEYRCVAVVGVGSAEIPLPAEMAKAGSDPVEEKLVHRREACLLYVACTRAREDLWVGHAGKPSSLLPTG